jgi:hypothetical protein
MEIEGECIGNLGTHALRAVTAKTNPFHSAQLIYRLKGCAFAGWGQLMFLDLFFFERPRPKGNALRLCDSKDSF